MPAGSETRDVLAELYPSLHRWLRVGERLLLHQEELGDRVMGVAAGYLLWSGLLPDGPRAITAMEQLLRRQMGTVGRTIVTVVEEVPQLDPAGGQDDEVSQSAEGPSAASTGGVGSGEAGPESSETDRHPAGGPDELAYPIDAQGPP